MGPLALPSPPKVTEPGRLSSHPATVLVAPVRAELAGQPKDIQARYARILLLIESHGLKRLREPCVRHLPVGSGDARDGIARAIYVTAAGRRIVVVRVRQEDREDAPARDRAGAQASQGGDMSSGRIAMREIAEEWLKDLESRAEYQALDPEFVLASALIEARSRAGMTQAQVAAAMGITQAVIARLGRVKPLTRTLERFAKATDTRLASTSSRIVRKRNPRCQLRCDALV